MWLYVLALLLITGFSLLAVLAVSRTDGSRPMRQVPHKGEPGPTGGLPLCRSSYLESRRGDFSCSFVEFDERGDYLDFEQHKHCWQTIKRLGEEGPLLLVIYCHGWKNNSQSADVLRFNEFLAALARLCTTGKQPLRVHGVYIAWRGSYFKPVVRVDDLSALAAHFDEPIVDSDHHARFPSITALPNQLTYWGRKRGAEHRVSGVPIARSIFSYAAAADRLARKRGTRHRTILMGHSFGALMLERSVSEASVGSIVCQWPWFTRGEAAHLRNYLPFDLVLFLNSAAPSIYAKMLRDLADAHRTAGPHSQRPLFVSLTSAGDGATRFMHPLANWLAPIHPTMRRTYREQIFEGAAVDPPVGQGTFYRYTPGHNKFLKSHRIVRVETGMLPDLTPNEVLERNLSSARRGTFLTRESVHQAPLEWRIEPLEQVEHGGRTYQPLRSAYWIMECDRDLIASHGDVWNTRAVQAYAALLGLAEALR